MLFEICQISFDAGDDAADPLSIIVLPSNRFLIAAISSIDSSRRCRAGQDENTSKLKPSHESFDEEMRDEALHDGRGEVHLG